MKLNYFLATVLSGTILLSCQSHVDVSSDDQYNRQMPEMNRPFNNPDVVTLRKRMRSHYILSTSITAPTDFSVTIVN